MLGQVLFSGLALGSIYGLVALGFASNCTGTVNDVKRFAREAKSAGALVYVDAVQYAPHYAIDVQDLGADFLVVGRPITEAADPAAAARAIVADIAAARTRP